MFFKIGVLKNFLMFTRKQLCWRYFPMNTEKVLRADFLWLSLKRGTGNGERGTGNEVNHFPWNFAQWTIWRWWIHWWQYSFLRFLTPANVGTCHLSGHSFGQRTADVSFWWNFVLYTKWGWWIQSRQLFFVSLDACQIWHLSILAPVIF